MPSKANIAMAIWNIAKSLKTAAHVSWLWAEQNRVGVIAEMSAMLHGTA